MKTPHAAPSAPDPGSDHVPGPLTPDKVQRFRAHVAAVQEQRRERGVDLTRRPDPVEELIKARDAGFGE